MVDLGKGQVSHRFLIIPECPVPLLGRDLLTKLKAQIHLAPSEPKVAWGKPSTMILALRLEEEYRLHEKPKKKLVSGLDWWLSSFPKASAKMGGI